MPALKDTQSGSSASTAAPQHGAAGGREAAQVPAEQIPAEPLPDARLTARQVVGCGRWSAVAGVWHGRGSGRIEKQ